MPDNFNFHQASEDLLTDAMKSFAEWMGENWTTTPEEAEMLVDETPSPKEYARGYNAGVKSVLTALECWLEDM